MEKLLAAYDGPRGLAPDAVTNRDAFLISYGDMLGPPEAASDGKSGLARLKDFLSRYNKGAFSYLHILPFHPYSSDDGFSVIDYREVDGRFGSWNDLEALGGNTKLVFDFVINHGSVQSPWFKSFLKQEEPYKNWYLSRDPDYDYSQVVRPRTHPLLTPFTLADGVVRHVWTTFSADQVDYDFSNPAVLLEFVKIFLEYAKRGSRIVRLDAIAYLWKEDGSSCLHHPKTHAVVKLFRAVIEFLGLDLRILTETNVPHKDNISYFGEGDEAHMVYNFALPPLVLYGAVSGDTEPLKKWAKTLRGRENKELFLNFLASHDGVGLTPAKGLVDEDAFAAVIKTAEKRGALISYKASPEGPVPYELNCSYASIVAPPELGSVRERARAFLSAQAVLLSLPGLPAVYFHSWTGSENWKEGPGLLGYNRAINREKPPVDKVERELGDDDSFRSLVYRGFQKLLAFRSEEAAFSPESGMEILDSPAPVFAVQRGPDPKGRYVLCAMNFSGRDCAIPPSPGRTAFSQAFSLGPWESLWLASGGSRPDARISTR
ncbi:MAG: sugar phosphorylase [Spirochaetaceae bacterium]|nr:sugar phosphorylase [Spirochaetaceae bacterium]